MRSGNCSDRAQLRQAPIGNEMQVLFHHGCVHTQYATGHRVSSVFNLERGAFQNHLGDFLFELLSPQMGIFQLDLIDDIDTKVKVHRLVTENVLELLGDARHFVTAAHGQDLGEATVEENAFGHGVKPNQISQ